MHAAERSAIDRLGLSGRRARCWLMVRPTTATVEHLRLLGFASPAPAIVCRGERWQAEPPPQRHAEPPHQHHAEPPRQRHAEPPHQRHMRMLSCVASGSAGYARNIRCHTVSLETAGYDLYGSVYLG
jgi:hypothetical protein